MPEVPEDKRSKLATLAKQDAMAEPANFGQAERDLLAEMEAEWEEDWSEL
jgi:hypothetical protein